ncbi:MAG: hypothetical protein HQL30_12660 [Candidatus Omnitrophica bacterium]|nr:hypothetical protein [Candidatus Omnitrophota bacterium]
MANKCSVKGCRKKALASGKCRIHGASESEAPAKPVKKAAQPVKAAAKIKKVREAQTSELFSQAVKTPVKKIARDGVINKALFWAGKQFRNCEEVFKTS